MNTSNQTRFAPIGLMDKAFNYVNAAQTDIRATFARVRSERAQVDPDMADVEIANKRNLGHEKSLKHAATKRKTRAAYFSTREIFSK